jgi:ParB family chromosome partitioning protein
MNDLGGVFAGGMACCSPAEPDLVPAEVLISDSQMRAERLEAWAARFGGPALFIDPSEVRSWAGNARDYDSLTYDNVADLIDSIKSLGQSVAAVVRPIKDPIYKYEAVTGTRRLFAAKWLCQNDNEVPFIAICRFLSDEQAFLEADLENRVRNDVSVLERARNYAFALEPHFGGHQARMAAALGISAPQVTRYLSVASLPAVVIAAFGHEGVTLVNGHKIAKALEDSARSPYIMEEAKLIAEIQQAAERRGEAQLSATEVGRKLLNCHKPSKGEAERTVIMSEGGRPMATVMSVAKKGLTLRIHAGSGADVAELEAKLSGFLAELSAAGEFRFS